MGGEVAEIALMTDGLRLARAADPRHASFASVIERAVAGDSTAFDEIVTCYQRRVVSTAWRVLGNEEDARDAAQEVFLRLYKHLHKYDPERDFSGWLYRVVINACWDIARKRGPGAGLSSLETERELGELDTLSGSDDLEAAAILSQQRRIIAQALDTLSTREREAIVLRDLEGLSTQEVARILGTSQATVRSQISSARTKIKQYHGRLLKRGQRR